MGWAALSNGVLLKTAELAGFNAMVTWRSERLLQKNSYVTRLFGKEKLNQNSCIIVGYDQQLKSWYESDFARFYRWSNSRCVLYQTGWNEVTEA